MSGRTFMRALGAGFLRPDRGEEQLDRRAECGLAASEDPQIYGDVPLVAPGARDLPIVESPISVMAARSVFGRCVVAGHVCILAADAPFGDSPREDGREPGEGSCRAPQRCRGA
ncbi:MAG TPA: hypothetical protein VGO34_14785 [Alphaproteobacteria bacterium]|jgi:hypothetical protein